MSQYEKFFKQADTDKSGFLTLNELTAILKKNGYKEDKIKATFVSVDTSGDKKISREEFMAAMGQCSPKDHKAASMRSVFQSFDKNGDGTLSACEMEAALKEIGSHVSDADLKRLMVKLDKDKSGTITYEEFVHEVFGK